MSRPTECKDCGKRIAHEPGRRNRCLVCLDKRAKAREVPGFVRERYRVLYVDPPWFYNDRKVEPRIKQSRNRLGR